MAIISDFDSEDPGSIPGAASFFFALSQPTPPLAMLYIYLSCVSFFAVPSLEFNENHSFFPVNFIIENRPKSL
jgi:hypothetical protein